MEYQFTKENFNEEVINSDIPVLVDFYADWCGPCRMMLPVVEEMAKKYDGKVKVGKVNTDREPALAAKYGVMSIPSFVFIKNGQVVDTEVGGMPEAILSSKLESLISA
ncbi:thioredoxin [Butyrivibrio sp. WCD3002]|uniref:thioredoxin n=1 Tax=Butyrivibrio sp. WCD3002 TaxID=1280676 RepID=UPI00040DFCEF|nr:thioredoxin [Butyrivibrio sp. WCD3002]